MDNNEMITLLSQILDEKIGMVTAYAYAKSKGYAGSADDFANDMANIGVNISAIETAINTFNNETVPNAETAITTAGSNQVTAVNTAGQEQLQNVTAEGGRQVELVGYAGSSQTERVNVAGASQVENVNTAGSTQITNIDNAGATQITAIQTKGEETLESIPSDYSDLSNDVSQLVDHLGYNINQNYTGFQIGFYANGTGEYNPSRTDYVCTKSIIKVEPNSTVYLSDIPNAGYAYLITYNANRQYVNKGVIQVGISNHKVQLTVPADTYYVHIDINSGQSPMNPAEYADVIINTTQNTDVIAGLDARITDNTKRSTENKNELSEIVNYNQFGGWTVGLFSNANGAYYGNRTDYLCIADKMPVNEGDSVSIIINSPTTLQYIYFLWYDSNDTLLSHTDFTSTRQAAIIAPANVSYFHVSISKMYGEPMVMADYADTKLYINISHNDVYSNTLALRNNSDNLLLVNWTNYIYHFGEGLYRYNHTRLGTLTTFKTKFRYHVKADSGYYIAVGSFTGETPSVETETGVRTGWVTECVLEKDTYYVMNCKAADESAIYAVYFTNPHITIVRLNDDELGTNYVVTSDFTKKDVAPINLGTLTYMQSFCKYNGYYYSIDGTNISKQDSTFTEVSNAVLGTGHGNSLQLGHNGKAYASGWNDQKVYEVDLDTLTITDTITLPTTGYTTVAVDDVNKLMYIFQRDTSPTTEEYYSFIIYDYANAQIISTKKTTVAFGGMQAVDFVDGRIFVLNGLGTNAVPNGYRIYNTNGDIIAEYVLGSFATQEPEGICIDRVTKDVLISFGGKTVYKIS